MTRYIMLYQCFDILLLFLWNRSQISEEQTLSSVTQNFQPLPPKNNTNNYGRIYLVMCKFSMCADVVFSIRTIYLCMFFLLRARASFRAIIILFVWLPPSCTFNNINIIQRKNSRVIFYLVNIYCSAISVFHKRY